MKQEGSDTGSQPVMTIDKLIKEPKLGDVAKQTMYDYGFDCGFNEGVKEGVKNAKLEMISFLTVLGD